MEADLSAAPPSPAARTAARDARAALTRFAWLSVLAALVTIALKTAAWWLTGSVGLLSDAVESLVNLAAAVVALTMLHVAARPPDLEHAYGYSKAEYFASGFEGALIFLAAVAIIWTAIARLLAPLPLEDLGIGMAISAVASAVNLGVGLLLIHAGRRHGSIALEADGRHLLTDVWTSAGVIIGLVAVLVIGWYWLDPLIAIGVALNILWTGYLLIKRSALGLLDQALPVEQRAAIAAVLERFQAQGLQFHALRTRQAAGRGFVSVHVLVPGAWTVQRGHDLLEEIEAALRSAVPNISVFTHLEPIEDPASLLDRDLDR
jgi:cation diffusion facilitator family transporter